MPTIHIKVRGKVQGVFYRATAKEVAEEIGITGWVKNSEYGDVEIVASGSDSQLDAFISWCKKGPPRAVVTHVETTPRREVSFPSFTVKRD